MTVKFLTSQCEQIGNIPTKTSNANGTAWKFNSGLMICEKTVTTSVDITNQAGSIYESGAVSLGSWAESFIEAPRISVSVKTTASCWIGNHASYDSANAGNIVLMRGSSRESTSVIFDVIGIGKWK